MNFPTKSANILWVRPGPLLALRMLSFGAVESSAVAEENPQNIDKVTGKECPHDQMAKLGACAKIAAEQCIRWYASRSSELRSVAESTSKEESSFGDHYRNVEDVPILRSCDPRASIEKLRRDAN